MRTRTWLASISGITAIVALATSSCSSDNTPAADSGTPDGTTDAAKDSGGGDTSTDAGPKDAAVCVDAAVNTATFNSGSALWTCLQTACAPSVTACAADCNCNDAVFAALLCTADGGAGQTCFAPIANLTLGGPLLTCLSGNVGTCTPSPDGSVDAGREGGTEAGTEGGAETGSDSGDAAPQDAADGG